MPVQYTTVSGYFAQDDPTTAPKTFDYTVGDFGLIQQRYETDFEFDPSNSRTQWERFSHFLASLNKHAPQGVQYKLLYLGRHGEGYHNVAEARYGTLAWDAYWSKLDGDGQTTWDDAQLTATGVAQAHTAHEFWKRGLRAAKMPAPQTYYVSPHRRCIATALGTFSGLELPQGQPFAPVVKELLRECIGEHTCDRRSAKSVIEAEFPTCTFEPGFAETDPFWRADYRETDAEMIARVRSLLDDIFTSDSSTYISFSSHSGAIRAILAAVGHIVFPLATGAVIPVMVKATMV